MVYFTGDTHGSAFEVVRFCKRLKLTAEDTIVILGDVGANFCLDERDIAMKTALHRLKPTILCIHGNHEIRPVNIPSYITKDWNGGTVWFEETFPNILFARDGDLNFLGENLTLSHLCFTISERRQQCCRGRIDLVPTLRVKSDRYLPFYYLFRKR